MLGWDEYRWYRNNFGRVSSFALYDPDNKRDNGVPLIADTKEEYAHSKLGWRLNPVILGRYVPVFVALNFSGKDGQSKSDFQPFHISYNDSKLASLIDEVPAFKGAYITDLFKNAPESDSTKILELVDCGELVFNYEEFLQEILPLTHGVHTPLPILLGDAAEKVWLKFEVPLTYIRIHHYSYRVGIETYVKKCKELLIKEFDRLGL